MVLWGFPTVTPPVTSPERAGKWQSGKEGQAASRASLWGSASQGLTTTTSSLYFNFRWRKPCYFLHRVAHWSKFFKAVGAVGQNFTCRVLGFRFPPLKTGTENGPKSFQSTKFGGLMGRQARHGSDPENISSRNTCWTTYQIQINYSLKRKCLMTHCQRLEE